MGYPWALKILVLLLLLLALGGLFGGLALLSDPTGASLEMAEVLPLLPVASYRLPAFFLLVVMGLVPIVLAHGLLLRPRWTQPDRAWWGTVALGLVLGGWLLVQGLLIGFQWPIQYATAVVGVLILGLAGSGPVRRYYR